MKAGCSSEQLNNRFIHVGVDTSRYALLIGGRSSYPPCISYVTVPTVSVSNCFLLCWLLGVEVPAARICAVWVDNNTRHVCTPSIPAGLKCPSPIYDQLTITRLEVN